MGPSLLLILSHGKTASNVLLIHSIAALSAVDTSLMSSSQLASLVSHLQLTLIDSDNAHVTLLPISS